MRAAWAGLLALPLATLVLLVARPELDATWENHPAHFWLVLLAALVSVALAFATSQVVRRDARLVLVSLAFLVSAGFLALHALATPGVLLAGPNGGFVIATPVGLFLAALFAALSSLELSPRRAFEVVRRRGLLFGAVVALMAVWAVFSLAGWPPLDDPIDAEAASGPLRALAVAGVLLYAAASWRYLALYRRRRSLVPLAVVTAFVLLAEAMLAIAFARNWHLTWWEWHVLMLAAFGFVAASAWIEYKREASLAGAFTSIYLDGTLARLDRRYAEALRQLVAERPARDVGEELGLGSEALAALADTAGWVRELQRYVSPHVAAQARVPDDETRTITVLFADLQGFTSFSENAAPHEVVEMLNAYFDAAVAVLRAEDATIDKFVRDAVMAEFNALVDQPDHAVRAVRAGLRLQGETTRLAAAHPSWPRFRVGVNTGTARVGVVGTLEQRAVTVIGDAVNVASRLEERAEPGQVVISHQTYELLPEATVVEPLGEIDLKGRRARVEAFVVRALPAAAPDVAI
ncbi:MAG TPA: adenylate/guanylate cyclase domain-containing protein [Gaiellaceae bacterium]|nr:adenylate/guanylate cyclase domain-containing protein [Gaiellaceae bacterium]